MGREYMLWYRWCQKCIDWYRWLLSWYTLPLRIFYICTIGLWARLIAKYIALQFASWVAQYLTEPEPDPPWRRPRWKARE